MSVQTLLECVCDTIGEGPHWDDTADTLLYVDILSGYIHSWNSLTGKDEKYQFDDTVSFIVPCRKGGYIVGLGQTIAHFDWETKKLTDLHKVDDGKKTRFNDGKCDASGRLWCGTMDYEKGVMWSKQELAGSLYSLEVDGTLRKHKDKVGISNGLAWTADNKTMFYIDSIPRKIYAYDFDIKLGTMSNERILIDFTDADRNLTGFPDGMTIDTDNALWVACYFDSKVVKFDARTGKQLTSVDIPAERPTSCCFGGKQFEELFVTCSRSGMSDEEATRTPLAGSVFRVTNLGVKGTPALVYEG